MKRSIPAVMMCLLPFWALSQYFMWFAPLPLSDSGSDNRNAFVFSLIQQSSWIFWEKSTDSFSTSIYMRNLAQFPFPSPEVPVLSQPGLHYRNPTALIASEPQVMFYLFYEKDSAGNSDICYLKFHSGTSWTGPYTFAGGPVQQKNLSASIAPPGPLVIWQEGNDQIRYSYYDIPTMSFITPVQLADSNISSPVTNEHMISYIKDSLGTRMIRYMLWPPPPGPFSLSQPFTCFTAMEIGDLDVQRSNSMPENQFGLSWHYRNLGTYGAGMVDYPWSNTPYLLGPSGFNRSEPTAYRLDVPIDLNPGPSNFYAFVSDTTGNEEIFVTLWPFVMPFTWSNMHNISSYPGVDRSPQLWPHSSFLRTLLSWESFRDGHWNIFLSYYDVTGNVSCDQAGSPVTTLWPNPFSDVLNIRFNKEPVEPVTVRLFDATGREIWSECLDPSLIRSGGIIHGTANYPAGIYMIRISTDFYSETFKLIKT